MKIPLVLACLAPALLAACASAGSAALPVCDGRHRHPVNLHGTVLDPAAPVTAAAPTAPSTPSCL